MKSSRRDSRPLRGSGDRQGIEIRPATLSKGKGMTSQERGFMEMLTILTGYKELGVG